MMLYNRVTDTYSSKKLKLKTNNLRPSLEMCPAFHFLLCKFQFPRGTSGQDSSIKQKLKLGNENRMLQEMLTKIWMG